MAAREVQRQANRRFSGVFRAALALVEMETYGVHEFWGAILYLVVLQLQGETELHFQRSIMYPE